MGDTQTKLGLSISTLRRQGLEAAISEHDGRSAISYDLKLAYAGLEVEPEVKEFKKTLTKTKQKDSTMSAKQTITSFVGKNKTAVISTANLALGKVVVDTISARLPKEVGVLGPLVVAQLIATIPVANEHAVRAQEAALAYAMYEAYKNSDINGMLEDLLAVSEEL